MEEKLVEEWLRVDYGSGDGDGDGDGYGDGYGYGYGYGSGYGYGDGSGYGSGDGYGSGSGSGDGYGYGSGYGYGIKFYNSHKVFVVDGINTIFTGIKGNVARGFILNRDLTLEKTFIVKGHNEFAHGTSVREAMQSLQSKIFEDMDIEERIQEFRNKFNSTDKYLGSEFFEWHHILTGSCMQGRNSFVKNNDLSLDDKFTVKEFINLCKNDYGGEIIRQLEEYYQD